MQTEAATRPFRTLRAIPIFDGLDDAGLDELIAKSAIRAIPAATMVVEEGRRGDVMYVILDGHAEVCGTSDDGAQIKLATLACGDCFGEQALLSECGGRRNASVRALSQLSLLEIREAAFRRLLHALPSVSLSLRRIGAQQVHQRLLQQSALFRAIPVDAGIRGYLEKKSFDPGEVVFREGDIADDLYIVLDGAAAVSKQVEGRRKHLQTLGPGRYFGELALINSEPRSATVTAEGGLAVLALSGAGFIDLFHKSPELRARLACLNGLYRLPEGGFITLHPGKIALRPGDAADLAAITTVYHARSGPTLALTRALGQPIFHMTLIRRDRAGGRRIRYEDENAGVFRELVVENGAIVDAAGYGDWDDLGYLLETALASGKLAYRQIALFRTGGELRLGQDEYGLADDVVVCKCAGVTRAALKQAMCGGCWTAEQLADATGASRICGSCAPRLAEFAGHAGMDVVGRFEAIPVTAQVKSFRLTPKFTRPRAFLPGQHIRVEALVKGRWVQRSYTLTSIPGLSDFYEITVKRAGFFSSWLHDQLQAGDFLRVSAPGGGYRLPDADGAPFVCVAAGIGITPALAMARSYQQLGKRCLHLDVSARNEDEIPYLAELTEIAVRHPGVSIRTRSTVRDGHIGRADIGELVQAFPAAWFFVCGPGPFEHAVVEGLRAAGIDAGRIQTEQFDAAGAAGNAVPQYRELKPVLIVSVLAMILAAGFLAVPAIPFAQSVHAMQVRESLGDDLWRQVSGYGTLSLAALGLLMSARKRWKRFSFGAFSHWRFAHVLLGTAALVTLALHTGLAASGSLNLALLAAFMTTLFAGGLATVLRYLHARRSPGAAPELRGNALWAHILASSTLPALLAAHILAKYYF
jgi:ferredoxin-NADP reductase/CRP-like cAMP-binding protein/bacterioferritin-associated ferredoxin